MDVEINGEPFGLVEVDERDAVEAIRDGGFEFVKVPSGSLFEEILSNVLFHDGLERGHFHPYSFPFWRPGYVFIPSLNYPICPDDVRGQRVGLKIRK